jgi:hypothetical protein
MLPKFTRNQAQPKELKRENPAGAELAKNRENIKAIIKKQLLKSNY